MWLSFPTWEGIRVNKCVQYTVKAQKEKNMTRGNTVVIFKTMSDEYFECTLLPPLGLEGNIN